MTTTLNAPGRGPRIAASPVHIWNYRTRAGLTQLELAVAAGTTPSTISRLENGRQAPNLSTVYRIAQALGVSIDDLLEGSFAESLRPDRSDYR